MSELPKRLLTNVVWILKPILYADREEFDAAVRGYHARILGSDERWRPHERVLAVPRITLCFECWEGDDQVEPNVDLATEDPNGWTALDLLFAVQQRVADYLTTHDAALHDHCFFEGLSLRTADRDPPAYGIDLGS